MARRLSRIFRVRAGSRNPDSQLHGDRFRRAGATAEFRKAAGAWSRHPTGPVNQTTCAAT